LSTIEHIFKLTISDDGTGMGPGTKTRGIGLRNIKGRVNAYNGVVIIKTGTGEGFILEVTFLLNE
jgi:signal transduction histidine kinase